MTPPWCNNSPSCVQLRQKTDLKSNTAVKVKEEDALKLIKLASTVTTGIMAGSAFYINLVEHPARMQIDDVKSLHRQWKAGFDPACEASHGPRITDSYLRWNSSLRDKPPQRQALVDRRRHVSLERAIHIIGYYASLSVNPSVTTMS